MHKSQARFSASSETPQFTIDEGFAEDSNSQLESNLATFDATAAHFQQWIQAQGPEVRAEVAYEILRTLRTSQISTIVDKLTPLLHMDPIEKLPVEVTSMIFSHLDAHTLLTASLASQTWRERILDPRLWQDLYKREGWRVDAKEVKAFEEEYALRVRAEINRARSQTRHSTGKGQPLCKRRATSEWLDSKQRRVSADVATWREQHGEVEADNDPIEGGDHEMQDVGPSTVDSPSRPNKRQNHDSSDEMDYSQDASLTQSRDSTASASSFVSDLLVEDGQGDIKMNWPYLYKQRYKLEDNWLKGRYTNFQLPHPNFAHEAHTECVYTIQFHGRWLVSGSRDKTLRIWDLKTRRLRGKPLTGHNQSVLCLQFDPSEEEDVIISGSSDSSVIVWKFSTGQKLHVIPSAHEESVLNLKFDHRYLVTCSKDRNIKIWNRQSLSPLDENYPKISQHSHHARVPSYIVDTSSIEPSLLEAKLASGQIKILQPYMHLMTLEGHGAAVNAIQISGDLVVSASGDRLIRVWSIKDGVCLRVLPGHQKGIACVQFDNKRIVSGSSDHTVRVYDLITGVELAVLLGHQNLVRTVQAGFGDTPGSEEEDLAAAKAAERACLEDLLTGRVVENRDFIRRLRNGEAGSSRTGVGSKLPPGGGGSRWGRIVSGSYDESIIIWKKDSKGQWVPGQTLRQDASVRANIESDGSRQNGVTGANTRVRARRRGEPNDQQMAMSASQIVQQAMNASMAGLQTGIQNVMGITRSLNGNWTPASRPNNNNAPADTSMSSMSPAVQSAVNQIAAHAQIAARNVIQQAANNGGVQVHANLNTASSSSQAGQSLNISNQAQPSITTTTRTTSTGHTTQHQQQSQPQSSTQGMPQPVTNTTNINAQIPPQQTPTVARAVNDPQATASNNNAGTNPQIASVSRVFKLQFDARRIVCCSQDSRIIGWDFANGDAEIEAASQFFVGP